MTHTDLIAALNASARLQGLSYNQLAKLTGLSVSSISRVLNGHDLPRIDNFVKIAEALGMEVKLNTL